MIASKHIRIAQLKRYCKIDKSAHEKLLYKHQVTWQDIFNIGVRLYYDSCVSSIISEEMLK